MNLDNLILVRATDILPSDGVIKCLSKTPHLKVNTITPLAYELSSYLKEIGLIEQVDFSKMADDPNYLSTYSIKANSILAEYTPLMSDYNSMVLFALNGLVPDDNTHGFANNTFSNKNIIILEPLKYHINETVSLNSTDTAIKGDVYLSDDAVILIKNDFFNRLSDVEKKSIKGLNVILIGNNLTEEINNVLTNIFHVQPESLSLSPSSDYSSDEFKQNIALVIEYYKLSYKKFF